MKIIKYQTIICLILFLCVVSVYGQEQNTTKGEFAVHLAKLVTGKQLSADNAIAVLKDRGISLAPASEPILQPEMAAILARVLDFDPATAQKMDISNQNKATVSKLTGRVDVRQNPHSNWTPAVAGMLLNEDSTVRTAAGSLVELRVGMLGVVTIRENTELDIASLAARQDGSENIVIHLALGEITVNVEGLPAKTDWSTVTPTTLAAVRGTVYTVKVAPPDNVKGN